MMTYMRPGGVPSCWSRCPHCWRLCTNILQSLSPSCPAAHAGRKAHCQAAEFWNNNGVLICQFARSYNCFSMCLSRRRYISFSIKWVTSRNAGTRDNQIVLFDAQRAQDRRQDQLQRLGHSWWQAETKHWHGLQQSGIQWNSNQIQPGDNLMSAGVYLHTFDFLYMDCGWLSNRGIGQLKWKSFDIQIELFMGTLQLRYSEMSLSDNIEAKEYKTAGWLFTLVSTHATCLYLLPCITLCPPMMSAASHMMSLWCDYAAHLCDLGSSLAVVTASPSLSHSTLGSGLPVTW